MKKTRTIQHGLGPIGCACARLIDEWDSLELVPRLYRKRMPFPRSNDGDTEEALPGSC